jgi:hypothetical protein
VIQIKQLILILLFGILFNACASSIKEGKETIDFDKIRAKADKAFSELTIDTDSTKLTTNDSKKGRPVSVSRRYYKNVQSYNELVETLRAECLNQIATFIKITVESVYKSNVHEDENGYKEVWDRHIISQVDPTTFKIGELDYEPRTSESDLKEGDYLTFTIYFNEKKYFKRIQKEKEDKEEFAENYYVNAFKYYKESNLHKCLDELARCGYNVISGGMGAMTVDPESGDSILVLNAFNNLTNKISSHLRVDKLEDKEESIIEDNRVRFKQSDYRKSFFAQIVWPGNQNIKLNDIELEVHKAGKREKLGSGWTDSEGKAEIVIDALPDSIETLNAYIKINMEKEQLDDSSYLDNPSFVEFEKSILHESFEIQNKSFPNQNVVIVITGKEMNNGSVIDGVETIFGSSELPFNMIELTNTAEEKLKKYLEGDDSISAEKIESMAFDGVINIRLKDDRDKVKVNLKYYTLESLKERNPLIGFLSHAVPSNLGLKQSDGKKVAETFLEEYFYDKHRLVFSELKDDAYPIKIKGKSEDEDYTWFLNKGSKEKVIDKRFRFKSYTYSIESSGYKSKTITISSDKFDFTNGPKRNRGNLKAKKHDVTLKKLEGIMLISIKPDASDKFDPNKLKVRVRKKKFLFFTESDTILSGKKTHRYKPSVPGIFQINVHHGGFDDPSTQFQNIKFDNKEKKIEFSLGYKSSIKAQVKNTLVPGWGYQYMDRPFWQAPVALGTYGLFLGTGINSWYNYNNHKSEFEKYQSSYINAEIPLLANKNRNIADEEWSNMKTAKANFIAAFIGAGLTNIGTSLWLWIQTR